MAKSVKPQTATLEREAYEKFLAAAAAAKELKLEMKELETKHAAAMETVVKYAETSGKNLFNEGKATLENGVSLTWKKTGIRVVPKEGLTDEEVLNALAENGTGVKVVYDKLELEKLLETEPLVMASMGVETVVTTFSLLVK